MSVDIVRRFIHRDPNEGDGVKDDITALISWLSDRAFNEDLSTTLPRAIRLAQKVGDKRLEKWARLELSGYYQESGMQSEDVVPEYRTVGGQHTDEYGRVLMLPQPDLQFVNETRLRNGVRELEELAKKLGPLTMRDPHARELIQRHFDVQVTRFQFSPTAVAGILGIVRSKLFDHVNRIRDEQARR